MEELQAKIGDYIIVRSFPMGNNIDLVGKILVIRKQVITDIDIVITAKYPFDFYGENFPLKWRNPHWNRIKVLGNSLILTALYD